MGTDGNGEGYRPMDAETSATEAAEIAGNKILAQETTREIDKAEGTTADEREALADGFFEQQVRAGNMSKKEYSELTGKEFK